MTLQLSTNLIRFTDIVRSPEQLAKFTVQNVSNRPQRVRVTRPRTGVFAVDMENLQSLAPGMIQEIGILFRQPAGQPANEFTETLQVMSGTDQFELRLEAFGSFSEIYTDRSTVDFGTVAVGVVHRQDIVVLNKGNMDCDCTIEITQVQGTDCVLKAVVNGVEAKRITAEPQKPVSIQLSLNPGEPGTVHYLVRIRSQRQMLSSQVIATAQNPVLQILNATKKPLDDLVFKTQFFGVVSKTVLLYNPTPFLLNFSLRAISEETQKQADQAAKDMTFFSITPSDGIVKPGCVEEVEVQFDPKLSLEVLDKLNSRRSRFPLDQLKNDNPEESNWYQEGQFQLTTTLEQSVHKIALKMAGIAHRPAFGMSECGFQFSAPGAKQFVLKNLGQNPCTVFFKCPAGFHFFSETGPQSGQIDFNGKEAQQIDFWFRPRHQMRENSFLYLEFGGEYFCSSYAVNTNFDYAQTQALKQVLSKTNTGQISALQQRTAYLEEQRAACVLTEKTLTLTSQNAEKKTYDQEKFDKVLTAKTQNYQRFVHDVPDGDSSDSQEILAQDPKVDAYNDALDLGMDQDIYQQDVPHMLRADKRKDKVAEELTIQQENKDITLQHKERPALKNDTIPTVKQYFKGQFEPILFAKIEAEIKAKLSQRQTLTITTSSVKYDFGELTPHTAITKYFKIANDLAQYLKVELVAPQTNAVQFQVQDAQYIPPGCYTSFQIQMKFVELITSFNESIKILVNDTLFGYIEIQAKVVRPKLQISQQAYSFEKASQMLQTYVAQLKQGRQDGDFMNGLQRDVLFLELNGTNAFEKEIVKEILISNVGTSIAESIFSFTDKAPELGLNIDRKDIDVGDDVMLRLFWAPQQEELGSSLIQISFQRGYDPYYIPVICRLTPGKIQLNTKLVDYGLINVSRRVQSGLSLQNKGTAKPVYYELLSDEFDTKCVRLYCDQPRGEIPPGETFQLSYVLEAKAVGSFNQRLSLRVIGGDTLKITLKGEVEAPKLLVETLGASLKSIRGSPVRNAAPQKESVGQTDSLSFTPQIYSIDTEIPAKTPFIQRMKISNTGRVSADFFVDVRASRAVELLDSEPLEGASMKFVSRAEMVERLEQYAQVENAGAARKQAQTTSKAEPQTSANGQKQANQFDAMAGKFHVPYFKGATDTQYREYLNMLMSGQNVSEVYAHLVLKNQESQQKDQNKIVMVTLQPNAFIILGVSLTEDSGQGQSAALINYYVLGVQWPNDMLRDEETGQKIISLLQNEKLAGSAQEQQMERDKILEKQLGRNQMALRYKTINAMLQASTPRIQFGTKVADSAYKQTTLQEPVQLRDLFQRITAAAKEISNEETGQALPFMRYAAASGLYYQDITLASMQAKPVYFVAEIATLSDAPAENPQYFVSHPIGRLQAYDQIQIRVYYSPMEVGVHQQILKIYYYGPGAQGEKETIEQFYLSEMYRTAPALTINLQGVSVYKSLQFSTQEVVLPNTAVNVPSRALVFVYNIGYKNTTRLQVFFPPELSKCCLAVRFPWGNAINHMVKMLPIVISFCSATPLSFMAQLAVLDEENTPYSFRVAGNCFEQPTQLIEFLRYNGERVSVEKKTGLVLKKNGMNPDEEPENFPVLKQLEGCIHDPEMLAKWRRFGVQKAQLQALLSLDAQPVLQLSDYAANGMKLGAVVAGNGQNGSKQNLLSAREKTKAEGDLALLLSAPGVSQATYNQLGYRLSYFWQSQFKVSPGSEAPLTPLLQGLPDQLPMDELDKGRLYLSTLLLQQFTGLKAVGQNFFTFASTVNNRQSPALLWLAGLFRKEFPFQVRELQSIPVQEAPRAQFLRSAFEAAAVALKVHGGYINNVSSALLMPRADYVLCMKNLTARAARACFSTGSSANSDNVSVKEGAGERKGQDKAPGANGDTGAIASVGDAEPSICSQLIPQHAAQLITELFGVVHDQYSQSAWMHFLAEVSRIFIFNGCASKEYLSKTVQRHREFCLNDGSEFSLPRGVGGRLEKERTAEDFKALRAPVPVSDPDQNLLAVLGYFGAFQALNTLQTELPAPQNYQQLISGLHLGCFIISFIPQQTLCQKVEDMFGLLNKMQEAKKQRGKEFTGVLDALNATVRDADFTEKMHTQLEQARAGLWREITALLKSLFQLPVGPELFYTAQGNCSYWQLTQYAASIKLLAGYLYQIVPSYLLQKTIRLEADLGKTTQQAIEFLGNARYATKYIVGISQVQENVSCDVSANLQQLFLEQGKNASVQLTVTPQFIKPCFCILQLQPIYEHLNTGPIVPQANYIGVYIRVMDRGETQSYQLEQKCGGTARHTLVVKNDTSLNAKYQTEIQEVFYPIDPQKPIGKAVPKPGKSPQAFKTDRYLIAAGKQSKELVVQFCPTHPGLYVARLTLTDDQAGQKEFELRGIALLPEPAKTVWFLSQNTEPAEFVIRIQDLDLAGYGTQDLKYALIPQVQSQPGIPCGFADGQFKLKFKPHARFTQGTYSYKLVLLFEQLTKVCGVDIVILKKAETVSLEFEAQARQVTSNAIKIDNPDTQETEYQATLTGSSNFCLNGITGMQTFKLKIPAREAAQLQISFAPKWICDEKAHLNVVQTETGMIVQEVELHGISTAPSASGSLNLTGKVAEKIEQSLRFRAELDGQCRIRFEDPDQNVFSVQQKHILSKTGDNLEILVAAQSHLSGTYKQKMYLEQVNTLAYQTFDVSLTVLARECSGTVEGAAVVGEETVVKIKVGNPLKEYALFTATVQGIPDEFVSYPRQLSVAPEAQETFSLKFTPRATGNWDCKLKFYSTALGEFWWALKLRSEDVVPSKRECEAQIGQDAEVRLPVGNYLQPGSNLIYGIELSNMDAFGAVPQRSFQLDGGEEIDVVVLYRPTRVSSPEQCTVNIVGRDAADQLRHQLRFVITGKGVLQRSAPTIKIFSQLNQAASGVLQFKNPFGQRASINFQLQGNAEFQFTYKQEQLVDPGQMVSVKYVFQPTMLHVVQAQLKIIVNPNFDLDNGEQFPFDYLFVGTGEYTHRQPIAFFECQARQMLQKVVPLPTEIPITDELQPQIQFDVECPQDDYGAAVKRALQIGWAERVSGLTGTSSRQSQRLSAPLPPIGFAANTPQAQRALQIKFAPLKPFAVEVLLVLSQPDGGRYKLPLSLISRMPAPEGTLVVELPDGSTPGELQFGHANTLNVYSEFKAYFTAQSSERFAVSPQTGILEPGQAGISTVRAKKETIFTVRCLTGQSIAKGQLIVETKDIVYLWDVVSGYKKYVPPVGVGRVK